MPHRKWDLRIKDILTSIERIMEYTRNIDHENFLLDTKTVAADFLMKSTLSYCFIGMLLLSGAFLGCSDKKEPPPPEKGAIRQMTDEAAREAVKQIRTPIDKARSVAKQQEEKGKEMDDALKKQ